MTKISLTMDPSAMSIEGIREYHNQIVRDYGVGHVREGKFPDKATALKRLEGLLVNVKSSQTGGEKDDPAAHVEATVAKVKAAKVAKTKDGSTRSRLNADAVISVLAPDRKVRPDTETAAMWALYRDGMTVGQFLEAAKAVQLEKLTPAAYLSFDVRKGYVKVSG